MPPPECPVCRDNYNSDANQPLLLPCSHTLCRSCVSRVVMSGKISKCPGCTGSHDSVVAGQLNVNYSMLAVSWPPSSGATQTGTPQTQVALNVELRLARVALEDEKKKTEEERRKREQKVKEMSMAMEQMLSNEMKEKMMLKKELRLERKRKEEERKRTEEERRRREEEVLEKLKEISDVEEELCNEREGKMALKKELSLERGRREEERKRREKEVLEKVNKISEMEEKLKIDNNEKMALMEELRLAKDALEGESKKTEEERRRREEEVEEKLNEISEMEMELTAKLREKMTLKEELRLARDALEEEKKKTKEERRKREEVEKTVKEMSKIEMALRASIQEKMMLQKMIEEEKKWRVVERRKKEAAEEMLQEILEMEEKKKKRKEKNEEKEKTRMGDERRNEDLCDAMKKQEEKMREITEMNLQLQEFQKVCVDILRGERVDLASVMEFMSMAGGDNHQMHVAVTLGVPWLVEYVNNSKSYLLKARNRRGWTPLWLAAARGDDTIMKLLCQWEEDLETYSPPLLHVAAANHQHSAAEFLLKKVDKAATYKRFMAYQVANKVGDDDLARKIKPLIRTVLSYIAVMATPVPCNLSTEDIDDLMLIPPPRNSVNALSGSNRSQVSSTRSPDGEWLPSGLPNIGNTSYMNSVLQCLYHTTPLAATLRVLEGDTRQGEVAKATVKVMAALNSGENVNRDVLLQLKRVAGKKDAVYNNSEEQEAHDFLCLLLECLHEEMARPQKEERGKDAEGDSFISELFHGTFLSSITCEEWRVTHVLCGNTETFSNLSLPITHPTTLEEAVEQYFRPKELEWECDRCGREHTCQHVVSLTKAPPVLVLHLNRSSHPANSRQNAKVSYTEVLDVQLNTGEIRRYSLFAMCCHNGSMSSGHYTAYCKTGDQWYCFDDTSVTRTARENALKKYSADIIFYKIDMNCWVNLTDFSQY